MGQVKWTRRAERELIALHDYFHPLSSAYATQVTTAIVRRARLLENFPRLGRVIPEFDDELLREVIVDRYRLIYSVDGMDCIILALIDARRDLASWFDPNELSGDFGDLP